MLLKLIAILLALTSLSAHQAMADGDSVKVGVMASLSGNWASMGEMTRKGLTLAAEELNANGGVIGKKIVLQMQDTDEAVSAAKVVSTYRFLRSQGISIFVGPSGSPGGIALAPIASRDDILMVSPSVGVRDFHLAGNNLFNIQGDWENASAMLAKYAFKTGIRQIAIFSSQQPFELRQADAFQSTFLAAGGEVLVRQDPLPEHTDLRAQVLKIVRTKAPAIFFANYNQMGLSARQLKEAGFEGTQFATLIDASRLTSASGALNNTIFTRLIDNPENKFTEVFRKRFGEEPSFTADTAYDALLSIAKAAVIAGSFEPSPLKLAMKAVSFDGASGHISFDKDGCAIRKPTAWKVVGEKFEFVMPLK